MTTLSIQIKNAVLKRQGLENLDRAIPIIGAQRIFDAISRARQILATAGKKIRYPVHWDSARQRRFVIAMLRKQGNLPYRRTNAYIRAWKIRRNPSSQRTLAGYSLVNADPKAPYVGGDAYGNRQSRIHQGRWPVTRLVVEKAVSGLPQDIENHIGMVARRERLL